jgi:hypothetical protein
MLTGPDVTEHQGAAMALHFALRRRAPPQAGASYVAATQAK